MFVLVLALVTILYDRMFVPYVRQLANKLNLLVSGSQTVDSSVIIKEETADSRLHHAY